MVERILNDKPHPEQGYRSCMALIRTAKQYGHARTEEACRRALSIGAPTRKSVDAILKRGLDRAPVDDEANAPSRRPPAVKDTARYAFVLPVLFINSALRGRTAPMPKCLISSRARTCWSLTIFSLRR